VALLARDAVMLVCLAVLRRAGQGPPPVHYVGKTATFILLVAFPMLLLAAVTDSTAWYASGWALAWWGLVLYWIAGLFYLIQARSLLRARSAVAGPEVAG
jgi:cardiolipin synthase